jgi:hypothetical protein
MPPRRPTEPSLSWRWATHARESRSALLGSPARRPVPDCLALTGRLPLWRRCVTGACARARLCTAQARTSAGFALVAPPSAAVARPRPNATASAGSASRRRCPVRLALTPRTSVRVPPASSAAMALHPTQRHHSVGCVVPPQHLESGRTHLSPRTASPRPSHTARWLGVGTVRTGPDVSHYQGAVNWPAIKSAGVGFAIAKATEGTTYVDTQFKANWQVRCVRRLCVRQEHANAMCHVTMG